LPGRDGYFIPSKKFYPKDFLKLQSQLNVGWKKESNMLNTIAWTRNKACSALTIFLILHVTRAGLAQETKVSDYPLGKVQFPVSCSAEAQPEFNRAVALLHHMTYPQAKIAFEHVAELDPQCAMAHWGVAMTLFQPLWPTRPGPAELQQGWESVQKAKALAPPTEREKLFIAAAEAFFLEPTATDYWGRIHRWEQAMETLFRKFPDDSEVKAFFALAQLAVAQTSPNPLEYHNRAAEILLSIHKQNPIHPGSIHYLIHANDIRGREHESLEIVRSYSDIAPRNPHALHMPTHIFTRLGSWQEVIEWDLKAAEAALEYPAGDKGQYVWDEFPHAIEYLVYAYLQQGDDSAAAAQLRRLTTTEHLDPTFKTAFHLSSIPARYALERGDWQEAAELVPRPYETIDWDRFPWPEAVTWFAKGLGAAHSGRIEDAQHAHDHLKVLEDAADKAGEKLFTRQIQILELTVSAWIAHLQGNQEQGIELMEEATELEVATPKHPVTPGPTLPASEVFGNLLLELGKPEQALLAFKRSLELYPKRFNSLLGAARAAKELEDRQTAQQYYAELLTISADESKRVGVQESHNYIDMDITQKGEKAPGR
jgi:tetratricopeptide (TPR) repeat protein